MAARLHLRLVGTLGSPVTEAWSIGVNFAADGGSGVGDQAIVQAHAQAVADYIETSTPFQAALDEMSTAAVIQRVETYGYNFAGPAAASGVGQVVPFRAGSGSTSAPFQVARCVTLITGLPGARFRGRFYVPALAANIADTGKVPAPAGYLQAWAALFTQVESLWGGSSPIALGVYSQSSDVVTPVTQLRVGDVLDTQRRRRDALVETYSTLAY